MPGLRSARSNVDSKVTLITLAPDDVAPSDSGQDTGTLAKRSSFTSLRRSTRSTTVSTSTDLQTPPQSTSPNAVAGPSRSKDLASFAYNDPATPPRKRVKVELDDGNTTPGTPKTPRSAKKPMPILALDKPHPEPARWKEQYALIEHMRKGIIAPVDTMGCERPQTMQNMDPKTMRFHVLISLMLSSQTKDAITAQAVTNLHTTLPGGLTAESLAAATPDTVMECINKVGFWRRKTDYIQEAAKALLLREGEDRGDVPNTLEGLCELRGVGPKMAFLALQCAWDINAGIGVDVHVHRITNRLKWHKPPTTDPEKTRLNLQSWLPSHLHKPINPMMVGFGQMICLPVGPRCDVCLLGKRKLCPSRVSNVNAQGRKEVVYTFTDVDEVKLEKMEDVEEAIKGEDGVIKVEVTNGPLAKVEVGYDEGPLVKLEPGVMDQMAG